MRSVNFLKTSMYGRENLGSAKRLLGVIAIFGPMIHTAPYLTLLMLANPLRGQVGGGSALEIETFSRVWGYGTQTDKHLLESPCT
jgi:hypothetical protein